MNIIEIWKPVDGYEGLYEVSNLGRVKSLKYGNEKVLKPVKDKDGYLVVSLYRDGKRKMFKIHRLVAIAFIPNPEGFEQINHIDEDKTNNVALNIEWCDCKYNINFGSRNKRAATARSKPVEASRFSDFRTIEFRFASTMEAGRNGYSSGHVSDCCNRCYHYEGNNRYKGLYWRFAS